MHSQQKPEFERVDASILKEKLVDREGLKAVEKLLASEKLIEAVNTAWKDPSSKLISWRQLKALDRGSPVEKESKEEREGYHSVIFLQDKGHRKPYLIGPVIMQGGKAVLKNAYDLSNGDHVALKIVRNVTDDLAELELKNERRGLAFFNRYRGEQRYGTKAYMAQDFIAGKDLSVYKRDLEDLVIQLNANPTAAVGIFNTLVHIIGSSLDAIRLLHEEGFVHCDIKPGNLMLLKNSSEHPSASLIDRAIIIDFGSMDKELGRPKSPLLGTGAYLAPELFNQGDQMCYSKGSDAYALGVSLAPITQFFESPRLKLYFKRLSSEAMDSFTEIAKGSSSIVTRLAQNDESMRMNTSEAMVAFRMTLTNAYAKPKVIELIAEEKLSTEMKQLGLKELKDLQSTQKSEPMQDLRGPKI